LFVRVLRTLAPKTWRTVRAATPIARADFLLITARFGDGLPVLTCNSVAAGAFENTRVVGLTMK
jgi:hypothetical protein